MRFLQKWLSVNKPKAAILFKARILFDLDGRNDDWNFLRNTFDQCDTDENDE